MQHKILTISLLLAAAVVSACLDQRADYVDEPPLSSTESGDAADTETGGGADTEDVNDSGPIVADMGAENEPVCADAARVEIVEVICTSDSCTGRWQETDRWSTVFDSKDVLALQPVDPHVLWECQPDPSADLCVEIDSMGRVGCFWILNGWAVPVAPCCAAEEWGWLPIGDGMAVAAEAH